MLRSIFEELYVYTYAEQPLWWFRFIDDITGCWTGTLESLLKFVKFLNQQVETLKFTLEYSYTDIPFLDIRVIKERDGMLSTDLYKKDTDARNYLLYSSYHPLTCKKGIPFGQFLRVRKICSSLERYDINAVEMGQAFLRRGYPKDLIETSLIKARRIEREKLFFNVKLPTIHSSCLNTYFIQTYSGVSNIVNSLLLKHLPLLTKNPDLRGFNELKVTFGYRRPKNLKDHLVRAALPCREDTQGKKSQRPCWNSAKCRYCPKIDKTGRIKSLITGREYTCKTNVTCQSNNLIYALSCKICGIQYVGQTGRRLMDRFQGHFNVIAKNRNDSLISYHFNSENHTGHNDIVIHVLDFIAQDPINNKAKSLRIKIESNWIQRLRTVFPKGLNSMEQFG